jgi:hypothetical protein
VGGAAEAPLCPYVLSTKANDLGTRECSSARRNLSSRSNVWSIRVRLEIARSRRDLAIFNLAIDSKLRACDLVKLRLDDICSGAKVRHRATIVQKKTGRPVQFEITEKSRTSVEAWLPLLFPISLSKSTSCKSSNINPPICPAGASLGLKHRLGVGLLWHALDAAYEGRPDLSQDRQPPRSATPPRPYEAGERSPISLD